MSSGCMMEKEKREANIVIRVTPSLKERAEQLANAERRTLSSWIEGLIVDQMHMAEIRAEVANKPPRKRAQGGAK